MTKGLFHVVSHRVERDGKMEFVTASIYVNNRVYLKPRQRERLGLRAARAVCHTLNASEYFWPEKPKTRAELMAEER